VFIYNLLLIKYSKTGERGIADGMLCTDPHEAKIE